MGKTKKSANSSKSPEDQELHKVAKKPRKGVRLTSQSKYIVQNVRQFFEKERSVGMSIKRSCVVERTAAATGVSVRTVKYINKEITSQDGTLLTPLKRYSASRVRINPDEFDREIIRRVVHEFYVRKEYPTLAAVLEKVKEECRFPGGRYCLWRVLREMGFNYKKKDGKQFIYERADILVQRNTYLQHILKHRREKKTLIYMDETWVNAHHTNQYIWVDHDGKGGWKVPSGKGQRLIVVHAGGAEGWVQGADLVFRSKTNSADYHDEMNAEHFMDWFTHQLLPNIPPNSVIILDNATYHNKQKDKAPTTATRKDDIKKWLDEHNIEYSEKDIKKTLLDKVRQHRPKPLYLTDEVAEQHGHTVLRLPVAHCELNPIELAWASVKGYVAKQNKDFKLKDVERLTPQGFEHTTTDMWRNFCRHVIDIENRYIEQDGIVEDTVEEMRIEIGEDDDDDESEDEGEELMDDEDRQMIDTALQEANRPSTSSDSDICTNPRKDLTERLQQYDTNFLDSILPLP